MNRLSLGIGFVFAAITACVSPPPTTPPMTPSLPGDAGAGGLEPTTTPASSARKRTRTTASTPPARDGTKPKNGRALNPRDPQGRTVFVRADDHCFVEVPSPEKHPDGPASRATEVVDCPPEANDAAWDHCTAQIVVDEPGSKCFCVNGAANPRPMPNPTPCPGSITPK